MIDQICFDAGTIKKLSLSRMIESFYLTELHYTSSLSLLNQS